jgi:hypothetical protein
MDRPLPESVFDNLEQLNLKQLDPKDFPTLRDYYHYYQETVWARDSDPRKDLIDPHTD